MAIDLNDDIVQDFLVESREILERLGGQLVDLEQRGDDKELLNSIFRGFHTIKGGAGFLGLNPLVEICHRTEDIFNLLRNGEKQVSADLMDTVLQALDIVVEQFGQIEQGHDPKQAPDTLLQSLDQLKQPDGAAGASGKAGTSGAAPEQQSQSSAGMSEADFEQMLSEGEAESAAAQSDSDEITDEEFEQLLDELHGKGSHAGRPPAVEAAEGREVEPQKAAGDDEITEEEFEQLLDNLYGEGAAPGKHGEPPAVKAGAAEQATQHQQMEQQQAETGSGEGALQSEQDQKDEPAAKQSEPAKPAAGGGGQGGAGGGDDKGGGGGGRAAGGGQDGGQAAGGGGGAKVESSVRVDTSKLDEIMNLVGELVLVRNRLSNLRDILEDDRMSQAVSDLELVTSDLQSSVMKTRMQPIKKVFGRFPRVIRDLARQLQKEVSLETQGEDTDLDKNMVEALADPMVHLVRNSVDHGIEYPDEREAAGKPREGVVTLAAEQEGDHILLSITDDGRGMDADKLRSLAVKKGVMDQESASRLDDKEAFNLIFHAGFSSKEEISDVSGRGVGMDVVKNSLAKLNGTVDIDSELGRGTIMRIQLPLTLAILPTLMVKISGRKFALPMSVVREIFELNDVRTSVVNNRLVALVRNKAMPLFFLERWLHQTGEPVLATKREMAVASGGDNGEEVEDERQVITVIVGNQAVGFVVDEVIGLEEVVIKPLGAMLHGLPGLAGSTITGDGQIALIVDIPSLIKAHGRRL
ncbi:signal transduction histidine kinase CheA [Halorhodospira halochloris]|uniref:Chemotaxis protein CheA n=1 Tax=Halorhodospira halochloris TaxID=1052 RepID=A0A0X8XB96_HALHR|nr:chemotaxis protein CheA [Halorhodospira halochloris]MBK1651836.1 chemotaxis protein CheA [Halorhodospira halochloris]BAU58829.1 signal transduction histidine kinase CheA [Halorhodospira halochloris]